jgi:hypothetical protein
VSTCKRNGKKWRRFDRAIYPDVSLDRSTVVLKKWWLLETGCYKSSRGFYTQHREVTGAVLYIFWCQYTIFCISCLYARAASDGWLQKWFFLIALKISKNFWCTKKKLINFFSLLVPVCWFVEYFKCLQPTLPRCSCLYATMSFYCIHKLKFFS